MVPFKNSSVGIFSLILRISCELLSIQKEKGKETKRNQHLVVVGLKPDSNVVNLLMGDLNHVSVCSLFSEIISECHPFVLIFHSPVQGYQLLQKKISINDACHLYFHKPNVTGKQRNPLPGFLPPCPFLFLLLPIILTSLHTMLFQAIPILSRCCQFIF